MTPSFKAKFTTKKTIQGKSTLVISSNGVDRLKQDIVKVDNQADSKLDNELDSEIIELLDKNIRTLQDQLKVKDEQMEELHKRLKEQQELNRNNQVLLLREQEKNQKLQLETKEHIENKTVWEKIKDVFKK